MKLFSLVLVAFVACTVSTDEVQNLRGEKEAAQNEESAVGVAVKEPADTQEAEEPANDANAIGVPEEELKSQSLESPEAPASNDVDEGVELTLEELDASKAEDKSAWPGGPVRRRRRPGVGCRQWVTCVNGWWGGFRCSGNRYCRLWR